MFRGLKIYFGNLRYFGNFSGIVGGLGNVEILAIKAFWEIY
jgi:hypothetical protein